MLNPPSPNNGGLTETELNLWHFSCSSVDGQVIFVYLRPVVEKTFSDLYFYLGTNFVSK
jgi:hypothetical protein